MESFLAAVYACLGKLIADELKAWLPRMTEHVLRAAVTMLPGNQRERYDEEWRSFLADIPGRLSRFIASLGLVKAAYEISNRGIVTYSLIRLASVLLILTLAPVFLIAAALARLSDGWAPVLTNEFRGALTDDRTVITLVFRTDEVGLENFGPYVQLHSHHGLRFTPITDAEAKQTERRFGPVRLSPTGRLLIRLGLSRLPILINVLRGDFPFEDLRKLWVFANRRHQWCAQSLVVPADPLWLIRRQKHCLIILNREKT